MVNQDFSIFANDPVLTSLGNLSVAKLQSVLSTNIPEEMLDVPIGSYEVTNIRYTPRQKLIVGLTSQTGKKPIALRIFPRTALKNRLAKARQSHPTSTFLLDELNAVAWVFPGERKLNLQPLVDQSLLTDILHETRGYWLNDLELIHFVPEHTYTARVRGKRGNGAAVCEYLKIYYNDDGASTAELMHQLSSQTLDSYINIPADVSYFPEHRMLLQSELQRDPSATLSDAAAACALACFHRLSATVTHDLSSDTDADHDATLALICETFPAYLPEIRHVSTAVRHALRNAPSQNSEVLLHGDAHLGNLFPTLDGRVAVIDLDRVHLGPPEEDLASFFAFKIWLVLRDGNDAEKLLYKFPLFLQFYNAEASDPVSTRQAWLVLANKMITERVRRGISRGKIACASELTGFTRVAVACLDAAERCHD